MKDGIDLNGDIRALWAAFAAHGIYLKSIEFENFNHVAVGGERILGEVTVTVQTTDFE